MKLRVRFEFKLQDCWVGVYWKGHEINSSWHVWICVVPMLPLHIWYDWT